MVAWTQGFAPKPISIGHIWLGPPVLGYVSFGCFQIGFLPHLLGLVLFGFFTSNDTSDSSVLASFYNKSSKDKPGFQDTRVSTKTALRGPAIGADIP